MLFRLIPTQLVFIIHFCDRKNISFFTGIEPWVTPAQDVFDVGLLAIQPSTPTCNQREPPKDFIELIPLAIFVSGTALASVCHLENFICHEKERTKERMNDFCIIR